MFRLIKTELRADSIEVPPGENVLGRGPFLKVTDKRVSRNHALLISTGGKLEIVPKHVNPCFHRKNGSNNFTILAKDVPQLLQDGDEFSLLPKELIYKVEKITTSAGDDETASCLKSHSTEEIAVAEEKVERPQEPEIAPNGEDKSEDNGVICSKPRQLPPWLLAAASEGKGTTGKKDKQPSRVDKRSKPPEAPPDTKRNNVAKEDAVKTLATREPEELSEGSFAHCDEVPTDDDKPASPTADDNKLPSCPYGKKCYRKNPVHFKEYSHDFIDDDVTDDDNDKLACPYGTACYRKNPLHRKQYSHNAPPIADTADSSSTRTRRSKRKKVSALAGDSDDDGEPNTYDYTDSFIDDDGQSSEESTEYGGESEDSDWGPPDEDVSELVDEAKHFVSNKKMHNPT